jgi:hypothetical protein
MLGGANATDLSTGFHTLGLLDTWVFVVWKSLASRHILQANSFGYKTASAEQVGLEPACCDAQPSGGLFRIHAVNVAKPQGGLISRRQLIDSSKQNARFLPERTLINGTQSWVYSKSFNR